MQINRLLIALMHFNENYGRKQVVTKSGMEEDKTMLSYAKQGKCTPKIIPVPPTYQNNKIM